MSAPAGWYADPYPTSPGAPPQQRWFDGSLWTGHVAPLHVTTPGAPATTPDGAPLAGWWHRVAATVIDGFVICLMLLVVAFPLYRDPIQAAFETLSDLDTSPGQGAVAGVSADLRRVVLEIGLVGLVLNFVYQVGFLLWRQATPGKLALGLRVRLREQPGLPPRTVLVRWGVQFLAPGVVGLVPFVGLMGNVFTLVDDLWPLWDPQRQALHDKVARTNVVRVR